MFAHDTSQATLASSLGTATSTVGKWLTSANPPKGAALRGICTRIGIDPDNMLSKDLTYQILEEAKYTESLLADVDGSDQYKANSDLTKVVKQLTQVQDQLKTMVLENEKVLESMK